MSLPLRSLILTTTFSLVLTACEDSTGPVTRFDVAISNIVVPATAAPSDTIPVRFSYDANCGEREVTLRFGGDRLEVRVVGTRPRDAACPAVVVLAERTVLIPPADRALPYTITFAQPAGADSVRVVQSASALTVAK